MDPSNSQPDPYKPAQPRRPRGFAATPSSAGGGSSKREREKEKERTKLRERHRRAITSRMLAGLRQYGNFPLPARADMNDVLAALAREAGWTVDLDGTTYRSHQASGFGHQLPPPPKESSGTTHSGSSSSVMLRIDGSLSPPAAAGVGLSVCKESLGGNGERFQGGSSPINSVVVQCLDAGQVIHDDIGKHGNGFVGSPYIPVYVMLASGFVNNFSQLINEQGLREELSHLKSLDVDGVSVDCWWGIAEAWNPQKYEWSGYRQLFNIVREFKLKLQVVMAFHEYGGNNAVDPLISLPQWVLDIGKENQDIFFTDREGRRNTECLSWSVDKERVLKGRTGIEVYSDFMRSFRTEFDDLFIDGLISSVEIGLGASGQLKYPSFSERMGWSYPGIGEFQCYDRYFQQNLQKAAKLRGHSFWARGPDNAGHYNSRPNETGFFCDRGDYDSYYGRFFLQWYAQLLIDHADNVLSLASLTFEDTSIVVKIPAAYWWYKTASHAAELTAGYYNPSNRDGYSSVFKVLKKYSATIKLACSGLQSSGHENDAFADPEGLGWQVLNSAWDVGLGVAGVNMLSCYDREGYMRVVGVSKPKNDPDHHHFSLFVYQQPSPLVQGAVCFPDLVHFIKCMHGEISGDDLLS